MKKLVSNINYYIFSFFVGSIIGYFGEVIYSLIVRNKLISPGTLLGPWCPIYGIATVIIFFMVSSKSNFIVNFIKIFLIVSIDEYLAAFISEEFFGNRIWDYSNNFLNIQGRVCLSMSLIFTIGGLLVLYFVKPLLDKVYNKFLNSIKFINLVLASLFIADIISKILIKIF